MGITVLSLFDGMSCGQIALRDLGIEVEAYYASEIDRFCIAQTRLNFPDTIELGDVRSVEVGKLPKIDLVLAGSPCQGFSFAGKQLNFDAPRSALFFEFHRILTEIRAINPDVKFLLENVRMKKSCEEIISEYLGVRPVTINSALVSAQNRVRLYWSNLNIHKERNRKQGRGFGMEVKQPDEKSLAVRVGGKGMYDLIEEPAIIQRPRGYNQGGIHADKAPTLTANAWEQNNLLCVREVIQLNPSTESNGKQPYQQNRVYSPDGLSPALCSRRAGQAPAVVCVASRGRATADGRNEQFLEYAQPPGKTNCLTTVAKDNLLIASNDEGVTRIRRLTPTECSRLQTIPEWYRWECSATQQHKMLGNGWTVEVIKHILSYLTIK